MFKTDNIDELLQSMRLLSPEEINKLNINWINLSQRAIKHCIENLLSLNKTYEVMRSSFITFTYYYYIII